jgi:hypothetical protein
MVASMICLPVFDIRGAGLNWLCCERTQGVLGRLGSDIHSSHTGLVCLRHHIKVDVCRQMGHSHQTQRPVSFLPGL